MQNPEWYYNLTKPELTPPPMVFQIIWPLLYLMIAISLIIYLKKTPKIQRPLGIVFFSTQLLLNFLWPQIFFKMTSIGGALIILSLLIVTVFYTIIIFKKTSKIAAALLTPYLLWILFAWYLNFEIWHLNT